ncbi:MAG: NAD(+)/NADH kinase [Nitrososphaeraceae archaeon]
MKIALVGENSQDISLTAKIKKILENFNILTINMNEKNYDVANKVDLVLIAGGDRAMLDYFHKVVTDSSPALGIYESESTGFLAQIDVRNLESILPRLNKGDFSVDELVRLAVRVDGKEIEPVLNDVVVFPSKSATLMEHILRIDNKDVWHDNSDGVIVSTPTGSTAYSMSAGGPMVLQNSQVFIIVSVNSVDNTRRPLIVPNESKIEISEILSRFHGEVVLDGGRRIGIKKILECNKHSHAAKLVRLIGEDSATALIAKKIKIAEELLNMPPSAKLILKILEYEGAMSQKDLASKTLLPERTIRLSLGHLLNRGYVKKKTSLRDARQRIYELKI